MNGTALGMMIANAYFWAMANKLEATAMIVVMIAVLLVMSPRRNRTIK